MIKKKLIYNIGVLYIIIERDYVFGVRDGNRKLEMVGWYFGMFLGYDL